MPQEKYILVVDDEPGIRNFIRRNLELRAFKVLLASDGLEALAHFDQANVVLVILDIMLPNMDGLEVCRRIRQKSTVPIVMLTALGEDADKIAALDQGADDYLTKPFSVGELMARVKAVLRRSHWAFDEVPVSAGVKRFGGLEIDFEQKQVWRDGDPVKLSPTEFHLLQELALHPGKIFTHEALLRRVWGVEYRSESEYLRVYIGRLRRKLEANPSRPTHIMTEPGIGYYMTS
ncbi:response regulator transcription factor [Ktedonobacter racemifer]|uniref:Two component transcriptional regulator, winged helix family n=1 Tax=Ktedonobacter racemifer DSM 44963 TaxID=485913 RepID=D6U1A6_KTERA|nr:response regulator transcription factor [Ktedonobacter racemifer]EFH82596.1 two component transcriptional regulator, winged helix family [Ktedonobacter racemifer DSM 44963]